MTKVKADVSAKFIAALDGIRARGDVRYCLEGIYVEPMKGGGVILVATNNGHMMLVCKDENGYANRPFILRTRKEMIAACKHNARKRRHIDDSVTRLIVTGGFVYAMQRHYEKAEGYSPRKPSVKNPMLAHAAFPLDEIDGKFPDWRSVLPKPRAESSFEKAIPAIHFNPEYIVAFNQAFQVAGGRPDMGLMFSFATPTSVIGIRPNHFELKGCVFGALMPMRGDDDARIIPEWIAKEQEKTDD